VKTTIHITKKDLDKDNYYKEDGIGTYSEPFDAEIISDENLGYIRFKEGVYVTGGITIKAGSGIEAGWGIEAGYGIKVGDCIEAGDGIVSLYSYIKAKLSIDFSTTISAGIFSTSGAKDIEAREINGKVIYGNVILLKDTEKTITIDGKDIKISE